MAIKDMKTSYVTELWWNGKGAHDITVNGRHKNEVKNHIVRIQNADTTISGPFIFTKFTHGMSLFLLKYAKFKNSKIRKLNKSGFFT